jgi:hypothetical protein
MTFQNPAAKAKTTRPSWFNSLMQVRSRPRMTNVADLPPYLREDIGVPRDARHLHP